MTVDLAGSKTDFLRILQLLGTRPANSYYDFHLETCGIREVHAVFLSCSHEVWKQAIGEPQGVVSYNHAMTNMPLQSWEHPCADGLVKCVGHLFQRSSGIPWVIVARVYLLYP
jgi:hypothetical protein